MKIDLVNARSEDALPPSAFSMQVSVQICEQSHVDVVGDKRRNGWAFVQDCGDLAFLKQVGPKPRVGRLWSGSPGVVRTSLSARGSGYQQRNTLHGWAIPP